MKSKFSFRAIGSLTLAMMSYGYGSIGWSSNDGQPIQEPQTTLQQAQYPPTVQRPETSQVPVAPAIVQCPSQSQQTAQQANPHQAVMIQVPVNAQGQENSDFAQMKLIGKDVAMNASANTNLFHIWSKGQAVDDLPGVSGDAIWRRFGWANPYWYAGYRPHYYNTYHYNYGSPYYYNYPYSFTFSGYPYWGYRYYYYPSIY